MEQSAKKAIKEKGDIKGNHIEFFCFFFYIFVSFQTVHFDGAFFLLFGRKHLNLNTLRCDSLSQKPKHKKERAKQRWNIH